MSKGKCLCGSITWEISGKPVSAYHCHCKMCRKAHGAAFGTYYFIEKENFKWTSELSTLKDYRSSPALVRAFCNACGSVVPNVDDDETFMFVPAGSHDDGPEIDENIFVASKAPWHDINDNLVQHSSYPPDVDLPEITEEPLSKPAKGALRGSCLCGEISFQVIKPFKVIHNCYCGRCRQARAAAFTTNGFVSMDEVVYSKGEENLLFHKVPDARFFTHVFCKTCGSGMPRKDPERNIAVVPLGSLDDDPGCKADNNIFVSYKADWTYINEEIPAFEEGPTPGN